MFLPKSINNYLKNKEKNSPIVITELIGILRRSGHKNHTVFFDENQKFVLLDTSKDIMSGISVKGKEVKDFNNTDDLRAVTVNAYARYNVLNLISNNEDLERAKEIFKGKRTWVIHCVKNDEGVFEAHTHGMENYSHPNFRIKLNIGEEETAYLLNSLCKSVQRGNSFNDEDRIGNLYENFDIVLTKSENEFFDIQLIDLMAPSPQNTTSDDTTSDTSVSEKEEENEVGNDVESGVSTETENEAENAADSEVKSEDEQKVEIEIQKESEAENRIETTN